ncbi:Hypothetical predicted protein [Podarcis lilfordi]|uniref:Uncharacterized protein n=1 Tax=Podarcis lilfordi TaxID=74358 RepID=A0AA35JS14_9SAUR|nr:Hypothetical predicted protein [Podarcis lilfordi]
MRRGCLLLLICGFLSQSQEAKRCWWEASIIGTFGMNLDPKGWDGLSALIEFLEQDMCQGSVALRLNTLALQFCSSQLKSGANYNRSEFGRAQLNSVSLPPPTRFTLLLNIWAFLEEKNHPPITVADYCLPRGLNAWRAEMGGFNRGTIVKQRFLD